jgi:DNA modification methylase
MSLDKFVFSDFDFSELSSPDFKEDSVREELVKPLLNALGYSVSGRNKIRRSKALKHPFVKVGAGKREITVIPDYLLEVSGKYAWVLDAKAPDEEVKAGENVEQAYFYAIHPDIRVRIYALCNGREFIAFAVDETEPVIYFHLSEIEKHFSELKSKLSPGVFETGKPVPLAVPTEEHFDYSAALPPGEIIARKQSAKRHFGVHGYFTRQAYDVVQAYVKTFTKPGDLVLDPFGGYGVTLLESLMLGRRAIHIDINPLSVFIAKGLIAPVQPAQIWSALGDIEKAFEEKRPGTPAAVRAALKNYAYPSGVRLMRNADVDSIEKLFTPIQLAELALLKHLILRIKDEDVRRCMMLAFSSTLTKINRTYHPSTTRGDNAGDSAAFRYYRYRIALQEVELDTLKTFEIKVKKLVAAKKEMAPVITKESVKNAKIYKGTATSLTSISSESVDYIYTDPPYGAKIAYLDLSVMWNSWLDLKVSEEDYALEAIEGGEHEKTKEQYASLIAESIKEMYRVLKFDRWMSFVFQHKDPAYWHLIVETAQKAGFEYVGTVTQQSGQQTFKKRQNPFTVLHGQLIINFRKARSPKSILKVDLGVEVAEIVMQTIEGVIARRMGATIEEIYNELIVRGMELGFLHDLSKHYQDLTPFLNEHFAFNEANKTYQIMKDAKFKTQIPVEVRIKYYLISYMRRCAHQRIYPTFDEIVLNIMPLLKNGTTPEHQTILGVLEEVAYREGHDRWRLKSIGQGELFEKELET